MKKIITGVFVTIVLSLAIASTTFGATTLRTETGVIITADVQNNYWEVLDTTGNVWFFYNGEDLENGDLVRVRFNTFGTGSIYDDEIVNIWCIGYVNNIEGFLEK